MSEAGSGGGFEGEVEVRDVWFGACRDAFNYMYEAGSVENQ